MVIAIQAAAVPAAPGVFSLDRLRLGSASGPENYLYTPGNVVSPEGGADAGAYYRFVVTDAAGAIRNPGFPCTPAANFETTDNTYTVAPTDPVSNSIAWRFTLQQFATATCTGTPTKTAFKGFYVAKPTLFADAALTTPATSFPAGSTAYVSVAGMKPGLKDWTTTWVTPSGGVACANTAGNDRADSDGFGRFPSTVAGFHQYRPSLASGGVALWNREANYETRPCPSFAPANDGTWHLRLQIDATNFVDLTVFSVESTPPLPPSIDSAPASPSSSTSASFAFSSGESGVSFLCRVDGASFSACTSPTGYTSLAEGAHSFQVKARDAAGNESTASTHSWTIDTSPPPPPSIDSAPANPTNSTSASFAFSSGESGVSFLCQLDGAGFSACMSPTGYTSLGDGGHSFQVKARDAAGNESSASTHSWTIDTGAPPPPSIDSAPASPSSSTSASFAFSSSESGVSFLCRLDGASFSACTSPKGYSGLGDGGHSFQVKARDAAGNESTASTHGWTIDLPPTVTLSAPANGSSSNDTTPTFAGTASTGPDDSNSVMVNVYAGSSPTGTPVQSLLAFREALGAYSVEATTPLSEGTYTARAEQTDLGGNTGLSSANTFTITSDDITPPVVTLTSPAQGSAGSDATPSFAGTGGTAPSDSGNVTVKVYSGTSPTGTPAQTLTAALDAEGAYSIEASPALTDGTYTAQTEQSDQAGNIGLSAARTFVVDTGAPPPPSIDSAPANPTNSTSASFAFSSGESGVSFLCQLDGAGFSACTSPKGYSGLDEGGHNFEVKARDAAGNESTASTHGWTIDLPPTVTLSAPANGSSSNDTTPTFTGTASTGTDDSSSVMVNVYAGSSPTGTPVQSLLAFRDALGAYSVEAPTPLSEGTYTARAEQTDLGGNTGLSSANAFVIAVGGYRLEVLGDSPRGYWRLGESNGTSALDETGANPGTYVGGVGLGQPGALATEPNTSASFDGVNDYMTVPDSASLRLTTGATLEAFVKRSKSGVWQVIASKPGNGQSKLENYALWFNTLDRAVGFFGDGTSYVRVDSPTAIDTNWHHLAVTYDNATAKMYIDGVLRASTASTIRLTANTLPLNVGRTSSNTNFLGGRVDELAVYGTALSAARIQAHYDAATSFDLTPPAITLTSPSNGSRTNDTTPTFSGSAGTAPGDSTAVTVKIYAGTTATGTPVQTRAATRDGAGNYSVDASPALAEGTYTAQSEQSDLAHNDGRSSPTTFEITSGDITPPTITLTEPANGSSTSATPIFSGVAGTEADDSTTVTIKVYLGSSATGSPVQTLVTTRDGAGNYSSTASTLSAGTYTAQSEQADTAGNIGRSSTTTITVGSEYRAAVMADNPRGYWRLGETVGATTAVDQTGANPGAYSGGVTLGQASNVSSDSDTAASFDGTSGRVTVPDSNSLDLTSGVTVESWIKRTKSGVWQVVVSKPGNGASKNENYAIWVSTVDKAVAFFGDGTSFVRVDSPTPLDTAWHFVTASYDNATAKLYVDGTLVASTPSTIRLTANALPLNIGRTNDNLSFFGGMLDEIAIFPTALSSTRIAAHYAASRAGETTPPPVTLSTPEPGSSTKDTTPAFAGMAGITGVDSTTVTVKLYSGPSATGTPIQTRTTTRWPRGSWDVSASAPALADGTYTVQAEQSDVNGNVGFTAPSTFTVDSNPAAGGDPVILGAGDIADCTGSGDEATSDLFPLFPSAPVLTFGDNAYDNGTVSQFNNCYDPSWGRAKTRTRPTIGGHDYETTNGAGYFGYFQDQLAPFGASASDPLRAYYSYDLGSWHVVHTNTECIDVSGCDVNAQVAWLRADLQAHPTSCTLVITHNPRWSSGSVHGDNTNIHAYWQAMYDNNVDLVLTGDDHDYERFAPQNPSGNWDTQRGIREIVVGTGGYSHYLFSPGGIIKANSEVRNDDTFGLIKVTLHPTSYEWEFLPQAGKIFTDSGNDTCH